METQDNQSKTWYANMFPQGTVVASETYGPKLYVVESVSKDPRTEFCLNVRELLNGETPNDTLEELYPAWVNEIVTRGTGPLIRKKHFTKWHFPKNTVFEVDYSLHHGPEYDAGQRVETLKFEAISVEVDVDGDYVVRRQLHDDGTHGGFLDCICPSHVNRIIKRGPGNVVVNSLR